jgi:hypothetical protein
MVGDGVWYFSLASHGGKDSATVSIPVYPPTWSETVP